MRLNLRPWKGNRRWRLPLLVAGIWFLCYVACYVALSRRGYAEADAYKFKGFYYFTPEPTEPWRYKNYGCTYLFAPLNIVDRSLGLGRDPASEPLWGLSNVPKK